jgi:hypothetical protein
MLASRSPKSGRRNAVSLELPKNASITGTSLHHRRTRGGENKINPSPPSDPARDGDPRPGRSVRRWAD